MRPRARAVERNTKGSRLDNKIGITDKCWLSPQQAARARALQHRRSELTREAALAWPGTFGSALSAWVAVWHVLARQPIGPDLMLGACALFFGISVWMCVTGCRARYLLEHLPRQ